MMVGPLEFCVETSRVADILRRLTRFTEMMWSASSILLVSSSSTVLSSLMLSKSSRCSTTLLIEYVC